MAELTPSNATSDAVAVHMNAGTNEQHVDRFGRLAEAGVQTAVVSLADVALEGSVAGFAAVIEALSGS